MRPPRPLPRADRTAQQPPTVPPTEPAPPRDPDAVPEGWEGIMAPGEQILWHGRPIRRFGRGQVVLRVVFGILFAAFGLSAMIGAGAGPGGSWMAGLLPVLLGVGFAVAAVLNERMRIDGTFYTLSDRAAYIARRHWVRGKVLETYPITAEMPLAIRGGDKAGDVIFAHRPGRSGTKTTARGIGFFDIIGAPEVFAILKHAREAQR